MNAQQIVTSLIGGLYLAIILAMIALLISLPFVLLTLGLRRSWQVARHLTALTGIVVALVGTAAIAGYVLINAHHFRDDPGRGNRQPFWGMHGEELGHVHSAPVSDDDRRNVEAVVRAERRWYAERTGMLAGGLLLVTSTVYGLARLSGGWVRQPAVRAAPLTLT